MMHTGAGFGNVPKFFLLSFRTEKVNYYIRIPAKYLFSEIDKKNKLRQKLEHGNVKTRINAGEILLVIVIKF